MLERRQPRLLVRGCVLGALVAAWCCARLLFATSPPRFVPASSIDSFRNMNFVHCFYVQACCVAALAAGFSRAIELEGEEGGEGREVEEVRAVRLVVVPLATFLVVSAARDAMGREPAADGARAPRFSQRVRVAARLGTGVLLAALCFGVSTRVAPRDWCMVAPALVLADVMFETWACELVGAVV